MFIAEIKMCIRDRRDAFIVQIFELDPYEDSFYSKLIDTMGDEDDSIGKFSEFFGVKMCIRDRVKNSTTSVTLWLSVTQNAPSTVS